MPNIEWIRENVEWNVEGCEDFIEWIRENFEGCEDFELISENGGGDYEWWTFDVFYSPSQKRYFWYDDCGCSCDAPYDNVRSRSAFEDGDYKTTIEAIKRIMTEGDGYYYNAVDFNRTLEAIRKNNFRLKNS